MISNGLRAVVDQMAKAQARSPQQVECFQAGAEAVVRLIQEMGVEQTVLPGIRAQIQEMDSRLNAAAEFSRRFQNQFAPVPLDERAQQVITLTQALLKVYQEQLMTERTPSGGYSKNIGGSMGAVVARCVSYTVWAYLNPGVPFAPGIDEAAD